jgi:hypothetical protein
MPARRLKDLMPKRPRYHEALPDRLSERLIRLHQRLAEVSYIRKQSLEQGLDRFCHDPEPKHEIAVWE